MEQYSKVKSGTTTLLILLLLLVGKANVAWSQQAAIKFRNHDQAGKEYHEGDTIQVDVQINYTGQFCSDGLKQVHFYTKGLSISGKSGWKNESDNWWVNQLTMIVQKTNGHPQLTVIRRTDKNNVFGQVTF